MVGHAMASSMNPYFFILLSSDAPHEQHQQFSLISAIFLFFIKKMIGKFY